MTNLSSESIVTLVETEKSVPDKAEVREAVLNPNYYWGGVSPKNLPDKLKWMIGFNKTEGEAWTPEKAEGRIKGYLRALIAERVSSLIEIGQAETVYQSPNMSGDLLSDLSIASLNQITGQYTKEGALKFAVSRSLEKSPVKYPNLLSGLEERWATLADLVQRTNKEIVEGYASKDLGDRPSGGIFYEEGVVPDAFAIDLDSNILGLVEVKAYLPREVEIMVTNIRNSERRVPRTHVSTEIGEMDLGVDLDREVKFVDIIRTNGFSQSVALNEKAVIILRFPKDSSDEYLKEYGKIIVDYGFVNVLIQKLPFSSEEITQLSRRCVKSRMPELEWGGNRMNFSERELQVLRKFAGEQEG